MNTELENILIDCLDALERGDSLAAILSSYPQQAEELRPFLETTLLLGNLNLQPSLDAQTRSQKAFLAQADALRSQKARGFGWQRALKPVAGLVVFLFLISASLLPLSANAVPGDALYDFKRLAEDVRLGVTGNAERKLDLIEAYKETRRQEVKSLLVNGQDANDVAFEGSIERIADDLWQIAGISVQITPETQIEGRPEIGLLAMVSGNIRQGNLVALTISIPEGGAPAILPTPTPTDTAVPTLTPSSTATGTPEPTATATPSPTPTATHTSTPSPTATTMPPTDTAVPPPTFTNTPAPPANDNDDTDDNSDDNNDNDNDDNSNDNDNDNDNDNENENENDNKNDNDNDSLDT